MSLPIVFIHTGFAEHLWIATRQARLTNPDLPIVLLGDRKNRKIKWVTQHYDVADHFDSAKEFEKVYKHRSTNGIKFELFCFQRWFVLLQWMKEQGIERCWCHDSDVMIYSDMSELADQYSDVDLVICAKSGHSLLVQNRQGLEDFCNYVLRMYTDETLDAKLNAFFEQRQSEGGLGGISDMLAFEYFAHEFPERVASSHQSYERGIVDPGMHVTGDFVGDVRKSIHWKNALPYGRLKDGNEAVRFHSLHFQGGNKRLMASHASQPDLGLLGICIRRRTIARLKRIA